MQDNETNCQDIAAMLTKGVKFAEIVTKNILLLTLEIINKGLVNCTPQLVDKWDGMPNKWTDKGKFGQFRIMADKFIWTLGKY